MSHSAPTPPQLPASQIIGNPLQPPDDDLVVQLQLEVAKQVVVSRLETVRTAAVALQTLNGLFLTAYLTFLAVVRTNPGSTTFNLFGAIWPIPCFLASLIVAFVSSVAHPGFWLVVGDLDAAIEAYEQIVRSKRRQLIIPALLTLIGLVSAIWKVLTF
jgi:hypothetical protein